jgi:hypothetical protein
MIEPDATILLFFVFPMRAAKLLYVSIVVTVLCIVGAVLSIPTFVGVAHGAHLGGILFAIGYMRWGMGAGGLLAGWRAWRSRTQEKLHANRQRRPSIARLDSTSPPAASGGKEMEEEFMSHEVDPILDKISAHGIQSLSERERKILQAARSRMSRR